MPRHTRTVAALTLPLLLTACSGGGGIQSSPQSVTAAVYDDLHAGEFSKACALVLPTTMARFTAAGTDCQSFFAKQYDPGKRAALKDVKVDAKAIEVNGDTAVIPESAVTFGGHPSSDGDTKVALQDGKWFVTG